ncbi:PDR/VanB family oxidoreductase [Nocardioides sp.]|uniref:PDR/VanB family oxidoreductase n=1 Tax=Nocardioides sp. TaxID=35761 RepID=UPI0039E4804B
MTFDLDLVVTAIDDAVSGVRTVVFEAHDGGSLPAFVPGSHLAIDAGGRINAYSLTSAGTAPRSYSISVLRVADGNGGSAWVHDKLSLGDVVRARMPRSAFAPIARASKHLLIAGGIGITPILSHLRAAAQWGRDVQVLYTFREGAGAHIEDILELDPRAELFTAGAEEFMARLREVLVDQPIGTHLYVCGPGPMIDAVLDTGTQLGWPESRLHFERFSLDSLGPGEPFEVRLTASGATVQVPSGTSLLEALEATGIEVPNLCRQGVCGECRLPVTGGTPLHRDLFLSDDEKAGGDAVMACVSRAEGPILEVAL